MEPLNNANIGLFFNQYPRHQFKRGELLMFPDSASQYVFYITEGRVAQYDITSDGNKTILNIFKSDAFFPMANILNQSPLKYFYEAMTDVTVFEAPGDEVVAYLRTHPEVMLDLLSRMYRGIEGVLERMSLLMAGSAQARILFELETAIARFGEVDESGNRSIKMTTSQLAQQTGLARETVSRELQKLKKSHQVKLTKRGYTVLRNSSDK